ncbi:leukotriene C4 synthase-like [Trematomus bernacchii]|uniref:leukotriene C4 synthase-like n=1 Tax=Trematomus bernacchii TaxID=40690 RepID=UPI00146C7320|nr:leukotriene C4 synthase-like [Trematomus bernacchii]
MSVSLAVVTVLGVLEQVYFFLQVYYVGTPQFERNFRAQLKCFPIFLIVLWISIVFFDEALSCLCGVLYLCTRLQDFHGLPAGGRLSPFLFLLIWFCLIGVLSTGSWT